MEQISIFQRIAYHSSFSIASLRDWTGRSVRSFHSIFFLFFGVFCSWAWMTVKVRAGISLLLANGRKDKDPAIADFREWPLARSPLSSRTSMRCSPFD